MNSEEAKVINHINLIPITQEFNKAQIETALIDIFLRKNNLSSNNIRLRHILKNKDNRVSSKIQDYLISKKVDLDLMSLEKIFELLNEESEKEASGSYYTPKFIVDFIVDNTIDSDGTVIDLTCGCGAFLLGAVEKLKKITNKDLIEIVENNIFGIDISTIAVERAKTIITLFLLINGENPKEIKFNIFSSDSLLVNWQEKFPQIMNKGGFDIVVGNPPYAKLDKSYDLSSLKSNLQTIVNNKSTINTYVLFLEIMLKITNKDKGRLGAIIPLSIAYSTDKSIQKLREIINKTYGSWRFSFYDRSPDSLFGDNIKTRNSIILWKANSQKVTSIYTTKLIRWNSKNRNKLFDNIEYINISDISIVNGIPKFSTKEEKFALSLLSKNNRLIGDYFELPLFGKSNIKTNVYFYSTAYNWLSVFRDIPISKDESDNIFTPDSLKSISLYNEKEANVVFAILNSHIAYWLWSVFGDGFHLTTSFVKNIPINAHLLDKNSFRELDNLGSRLSIESKKFPIVKINSGKSIGNYNILECRLIIEKIDRVLISELGLGGDFLLFLNSRHEELVKAGRIDYKNRYIFE